jgi:hypothetical protein
MSKVCLYPFRNGSYTRFPSLLLRQSGGNISDIPTFTYDYIVVGSGSSGCALSKVLKENGKNFVLLEKGDSEPAPETQIASNYPYTWQNSEYGVTTQSSIDLPPNNTDGLGRPIKYVYGTSKGGSSNINFLVAVRPSTDFLDQLSNDSNFTTGEMNNFLNDIITYYPLLSPQEGTGPIKISEIGGESEPTFRTELENSFNNGLGLSNLPNYNDRTNYGYGKYEQVFQYNGVRSSAGLLIPDVFPIGNIQVLSLIIEGNNVKGVNCVNTQTGEYVIYRANKEVILTSGVLETARIMIESGLETEITFKNHYGTSIVASNNSAKGNWATVGPIGFYNDNGVENLLLGVPRAYLSDEILVANKVLNCLTYDPSKTFSILGWILNPNTKSTITLSQNGEIVIDSGELYSEIDKTLLINLMNTMNACIPAGSTIIYPTVNLLDEDALYEQIKANPSITFHMFGSFGLNDKLDKNFKYIGYNGLRIADLSSLSTSPDGNTTLYAMLLGTMCGKSI